MVVSLKQTVFVFGLLLLAGCQSTPQADRLRQQGLASLPDSHTISAVPFYPQQQYYCGPTTLSEVFGYYGVKATPEEIAPKLFIPNKEGSLQLEMVSATRQYGFLPYTERGTLSSIMGLVKDDIPVIVFQNKKGLFEQADGGTIFLDEVGELTPEIQVKLLRTLQEGDVTRVGDDKTISVDVRVIAATHRNLIKMMKTGEFREDLFYRLAVGIIQIPPLRARRTDLSIILKELTASINQAGSLNPDYKPKQLSNKAIDYISKLPWKGNVRELWNTLNRAFITTNQIIIEADDIANSLIKRDDASTDSHATLVYGDSINIEHMVDNYRKKYVLAALSACGNNYTKAARMLGLKSHQRLKDWMAKLDIEIEK